MVGNCGSIAGGFSRITEATYTVEIRDRYNGATICTFDEGVGNFSRTLDGVSAAEFTVAADCGACDCPVQERRHELAFIRDDWPEPAWIGPIVRTVDDDAQGTIRYNAWDRLYWWEGVPAARDVINESPNEIDVVTLVETLAAMNEAYQPTGLQRKFDSARVQDLSGLLVESRLKQGESVWSVLVGLAKSVLDFTAVGEQLYWGAPEIPIADGPQILPAHFVSPPILDRDAESVVSQVVVIGAAGATGVWPPEGQDADQGLGKRTEFISDTNLNTVTEATDRARELYEINKQPTTFIITGEGSLSEDFPVPLHELIPGRNFLVTASGQCLESSEEKVQLFNLIVEVRTEANPVKQLVEYRVAADFGVAGLGAAERQSG